MIWNVSPHDIFHQTLANNNTIEDLKTLAASLYKLLFISGYKANLSPAKLKLADIGAGPELGKTKLS